MNIIQINPKPLYRLSPYLFMQFAEPLGTTDTSIDAAWDFMANKWQPRAFAAAGFPGMAALDWKDPLSLGMTKGSLPIASANTGTFQIAKFQNQVFFKATSVQIQGNLSLPNWYSIFLNVPAEYLPPWNNLLMPMQTWGPTDGGSIVTFCAGNEPPALWIIPTSWNSRGANYLHGIVTWYV